MKKYTCTTPEIDLDRKFCLPKGYLSYSQINTYLKCPYQYYKKYVMDEKSTIPAFAALEGSILDYQLEHYGVTGFVVPYEVAKSVLCTRMSTGIPVALREPLRLRNAIYWSDFLSMKKKMYIRDTQIQIGRMNKKGKVFKILGVPMIMFIDVAFSFYKESTKATVIGDYKNTKYPKTRKDVNNSLQLSLYAIGSGYDSVAYISFDREKAKLFQDNPLHPERSNVISIVTAQRKPAELEHVKRLVWDVADQITKGNFPRRHTESSDPVNPCSKSYCHIWNQCRGK